MFGVPSNFLGQATHTSGLFSGCSDMRHVPGISSVFFTAPQNDPLGFALCPFTETPWSPPKITGCGA